VIFPCGPSVQVHHQASRSSSPTMHRVFAISAPTMHRVFQYPLALHPCRYYYRGGYYCRLGAGTIHQHHVNKTCDDDDLENLQVEMLPKGVRTVTENLSHRLHPGGCVTRCWKVRSYPNTVAPSPRPPKHHPALSHLLYSQNTHCTQHPISLIAYSSRRGAALDASSHR